MVWLFAKIITVEAEVFKVFWQKVIIETAICLPERE